MRKSIYFFVLIFVFLTFLLNYILIAQDYIRVLEETWIYFILRAMDGLPVYLNPEKPPFAFNEYAPIYYYVAAFVGNVFTNTSPENSQFLYTILRLLSIGFCILSSFFSYKIIRLFKVKKIFAYTAFVVVFISFWMQSVVVRPDSLKTLFVIIGFFTLLSSINTKSYKLLIFSSISFTLAVFTKQDSIQFIIIACLSLLITRNYKSFWIFSLVSLTLALSLLFLFQQINNQYFINNLFGVASVEFLWEWFSKFIAIKFFIKLLPFIAISVFVCIKWIFKKETNQEFKLLSMFVLGSLFFSTLFSFRFGSEPCYYTEFQIFSIICVIINIFLISEKVIIVKKSLIISLVSLQVILFICIPSQLHNRYVFNYERYINCRERYNKALKVAMFFEKNKLLTPKDYIFTFQQIYSAFLYKNITFPCFMVEFPKFLFANPEDFPFKPKQLYNYDNFTKCVNDGTIKYLIFKKGEKLPVFLGNTFSQYLPRYEVEDYIIYQWTDNV